MNGTPRWSRVVLGGTPVDLLDETQAVDMIMDRAAGPWTHPLGVMSANLDHIHHFGDGGPSSMVPFTWAHPDAGHAGSGTVAATGAGELPPLTAEDAPEVRWLSLLDGAPLVRQATRLTGRTWPRLAGSDLIGQILDRAELGGLSVGFLGGMPETSATLAARLMAKRPGLQVGGLWAPDRADLTDADRSRVLAEKIRAAQLDILVVGLGKPRQERWIVEHGALTGASVLLAFGAVVDFLAGQVRRAPEAVRDHGMEWAWRLAMEPRRLARRYLAEGPPAYELLRRQSHVLNPTVPPDLQPLKVSPS